jgi:hypothetical protein
MKAIFPMLREKSMWRPLENDSADAGRRGGVTRSGNEGSVMGPHVQETSQSSFQPLKVLQG